MPTVGRIIEEQRVELEFRDGKRYVPLYLATNMEHLETYRYLYAEAVAEANKAMEGSVVSSAIDSVISGHFKEHR